MVGGDPVTQHRARRELSRKATKSEVVVRCFDTAHRAKGLRVIVLPSNMIALLVPPGEVALLAPGHVVQLRDALREAVFGAAEAEDRGQSGDASLHCFHTTIPCTDAVGRVRALTVSASVGPLVELAAPAGGVAILQPLKVGQLRDALRIARDTVLGQAPTVMQAASPVAESEQVAV